MRGAQVEQLRLFEEPGVPAVLVGRSEKLGWGLTTAYVDDQDVVIEALKGMQEAHNQEFPKFAALTPEQQAQYGPIFTLYETYYTHNGTILAESQDVFLTYFYRTEREIASRLSHSCSWFSQYSMRSRAMVRGMP